MTTTTTAPRRAVRHDVIQLDPMHCAWGAVLVIVTEAHEWGVQGYFLVPGNRGEEAKRAPVRVEHGHYHRIGEAAWVASPS